MLLIFSMNRKITDFISNQDLERFTAYLNPKLKDFIFFESDLVDHTQLDDIFHDGNYFAILFKENPVSSVGHWVLLVKHKPTKYEYFDCLGGLPPENLLRIFKQRSDFDGDIKVSWLNRPLMGQQEIDCGKYVILRINSLPTQLKTFVKFFDDISEKYSPSMFVNMFLNLPEF